MFHKTTQIGIVGLLVIILGIGFLSLYKNQSTKSNLDPEVQEILEVFAKKRMQAIPQHLKEEHEELEMILNTLIQNKREEGIKEKLQGLRTTLEKMEIADAPEMRNFVWAMTKLCISETLLQGDLRKAVNNCNASQTFNEETVDDITADAQILPYFLNAVGYIQEGDRATAKTYFQKIVTHKEMGLKVFGSENFMDIVGENYQKILSQAEEQL